MGEWALEQKGFRKILGWNIDSVESDESILLLPQIFAIALKILMVMKQTWPTKR